MLRGTTWARMAGGHHCSDQGGWMLKSDGWDLLGAWAQGKTLGLLLHFAGRALRKAEVKFPDDLA